eukprot:814751-Prymnesium_polylepis.2
MPPLSYAVSADVVVDMNALTAIARAGGDAIMEIYAMVGSTPKNKSLAGKLPKVPIAHSQFCHDACAANGVVGGRVQGRQQPADPRRQGRQQGDMRCVARSMAVDPDHLRGE